RPRRDRRRAAARAPERAGELPPAAGPDELLGLQHDRLLRTAQRVFRGGAGGAAGRPGRRVQGPGGRPAPGANPGEPHPRLPPPPTRARRAPRCAPAPCTPPRTPGPPPGTRAVTSTPPAAATRSTPGTP